MVQKYRILTAMADGVRETKKRETRRAISAAALRLASEHGLHGFTLEQVAVEAGVSPRTFFNYFSSKEAAITGLDDDELASVCIALEQRPADEGPVRALASVVIADDESLPAEAASHALRNELLQRFPELLPHHLAAQRGVERALSDALARRMGSSPFDLYPNVVVAATMGALRAATEWYQLVRPQSSLHEVLLGVVDQVEHGLEARR
jgi:AcrR family transcriptional regulator